MIYTIGHSTHDRETFLKILRVDTLIDVRSHPTSRHEQWRWENMKDWLPDAEIDLRWWPGLGGWTAKHYEQWNEPMLERGVDLSYYTKGKFPKQRIGQPIEGRRWTNRGLYDYSWFTAIPEFVDSLSALIEKFGGPGRDAAIMCCEALWWKCHRSMVADALWASGVEARHIKPRVVVRPTTAWWDSHERFVEDRLERYEPEIRAAWATGGIGA